MSYADIEEQHPQSPPRKKRRFFAEEDPIDQDEPLSAGPASVEQVDVGAVDETERPSEVTAPEFDEGVFAGIVGEELPKHAIQRIKDISGNDLQRAINVYFEGSWKLPNDVRPQSAIEQLRQHQRVVEDRNKPVIQTPPPPPAAIRHMPDKRYLGAFGVTGWATRSGSDLLRHGDKVAIERTKSAPKTKMGRGGKQVPTARQRQDVIVRFTNGKGEEVGRLENDAAAWISTLLDQRICRLEGNCVFAPDRLRTNDTVYLQLRVYMLKVAFESGRFIKPAEDNRQTGIFEAKETSDERDLRLRQVALVKLFDEISLQPSKVNATTEKHKRQGLLRAAEIAEQYDKEASNENKKTQASGNSSPPSEEEEEGKEVEQDQLDTLYKKAQSFDFDTPEAQPAETFNMDLRKYQKQALHWMLSKEQDQKSEHKQASMHPLWEEYAWPTKDVDDKDLPDVVDQPNFYVNPYSGELSLDFPVQEQNCLGGILADEMGLGKTIEMLSLIHSHKLGYSAADTTANGSSVLDLPRLPKSSSSVESAPRTTLVVAPMSLLAQWQSEAEKASKAGTLKVMMYYGSEKSANLQHLCCEANAAKAPNVIITSYGVVLSEFNQVAANGGNRGSHGGLFSLEYLRIILDEAHFIKNRQSKTAKACYELSAVHRWVLTGTPIVNRLEDLFSLVHFLRVEPWSNFSFWKTFITVPFEGGDFIRALDVVQTVLEPLVLRRTKDMKTPSGEALVPLPPRTIDVERLELSKEERDVYDHIFTRAKRTFNQNVEAGTLMKSYTTIFAQILRLRQSCCHPILTRNKNVVADEEDAAEAADISAGLADDMDLQSLIERFTVPDGEQDANSFGANVLKQIQSEENDECPICSEEPMIDRAVTGCWHSACKQCLLDYIEHQKNKGEIPRCFNCREPISSRDVFEVVRHDAEPDSPSMFRQGSSAEDGSNGTATPRISLRRIGINQSAKIDGLLTHLKRLKREEPWMKSVVFSQFTSFLDLITPALNRDHISHLRFDGSMPQKQRAAVLAEFVERKKGCVLLLSLRAGGVGLNLTCAKRVFMMDPWWSFAVEAQAIDRVHRMGQENEVVVTRFIVDGSIEEKMLRIQERKKFIASSLGMMSDEEKKLQRIEDIKELLS